MPSPVSAKFTANDAAVETGSALPYRPYSDAEIAYLRARVDDSRAAVSKIEDALEGWGVSLRTAKAELAAAEADLESAENGGQMS